MGHTSKTLATAVAAVLSLLRADARADVIFDVNRGAVGVATVDLSFAYSSLDDFGRERLESGVRRFGPIDAPDSAGVMNLSGSGSLEGVVGSSNHSSTTTFSGGVLLASGNGSTSTNSLMLPGDPEEHFNRINRGLTLTMYQLEFQVIGAPAPYSLSSMFSKSPTVFVPNGNVRSTFGDLRVRLNGSLGVIHDLHLDSEGTNSGSFSPTGMLDPGSYGLSVSAQASSSFGENISTTGGLATAQYNFSFSVGEPSPEIRWLNPVSGVFQVAENWNPQEVPAAEHIAVFDVPGTYTVQLDENVNNEGLRANGAGLNLTLDLKGHDYRLDEINIGGRDGDNVSITFAGTSEPVVSGAGAGKDGPAILADGDIIIDLLRAGHGGLADVNDTRVSTSTAVIANGGFVKVRGTRSRWDITSLLLLGNGGALHVTGGGNLRSTRAVVGQGAGPQNNTVNVADRNSVWDAEELIVGEFGRGLLLIDDEGLVKGRNITIGAEVGSQGEISLSDAELRQNAGEVLTVGSKGQGTLEIVDGGVVAAGQLFVGHLNTGMGTVTVNGGSSLAVSDAMSIGVAGNGTVNVSNGNVDALQLSVGETGTGTLAVSGGGKVIVSQSAVLGRSPGSMGTATIEGQSSGLEFQRLRVGDQGSGTLKILNNSIVSGREIDVGFEPGGSGLVEVDHASLLLLPAPFEAPGIEIGLRGGGTLSMKNESRVEVGDLSLGRFSGNGTATVESLSALRVDFELLVGGQGNAHLTVDGGSVERKGNPNGRSSIGPNGVLEVRRGHFHEGGQPGPGSFGGTLIVNGTLNVRSVDGGASVGQDVIRTTGQLTVGPAGYLGGSGVIRGSLAVLPGGLRGGTVRIGNSTGTLTIDGDYMQSGGLLEIEMAGTDAGQFDVLKVTGDATIGGELMLEFLDGFAPRQGDAFEFLDIGGTLSGQFAEVEVRNLAPEFQFDLRPEAGGLTMVALNDGVFVPPPPSNWNVDADGDWSSEANWTVDVPDNAGFVAVFGGKITAPRTVTVDEPITVGRIDFDSAHAYTVGGTEAITLNTNSFGEQINVSSGSHTISAPITLSDNTTFTVSPAAASLSITGALSASNVTLTKGGAGTLTVNNIRAAGLSINAGTLAIAPNGTNEGTSVLDGLTIAGDAMPTARLDLTNNATILDYDDASPAGTVRSQVLAGRGQTGFGATWTGQGITSSTAAAANAAEAESRSVGYAENSAMPLGPYTTFRGQPVDDTSILMANTRTGDANLDGIVNDDDVTIVGATYAPGVPQPAWALGDFDYNGFVDDDDVTLLGVFYEPNAAPLPTSVSAPTAVAAVPEPSSLAASIVILSILAIGAMAHRHRARTQ